MYHFVENSIQGGISMISTRHAQANSPSFPNTYDSSLPNQNLIYLDANNLYGWAMSQSLPTHGFHFLQQGEDFKLQEYLMMLRMVIYSKWIFTIQLTYMIVMMTTCSPLSHYWLIVVCTCPLSELYFQKLHLRGSSHPICRDKVKYVVHYRNLVPIGSCSHQSALRVDI